MDTGDRRCDGRDRIVFNCVCVVAARCANCDVDAHACQCAAGNGGGSDSCRRRYFSRGLEGEPAELSIIDAGAGATGTSHWAGLDFPGDYVGYGHRGGGNSDWDFDLGTTVASGCSELNLFGKPPRKIRTLQFQENSKSRKLQDVGKFKN